MAGSEKLEDRVRALEEAIVRLQDLEEIRSLKARYGELADRRYGPDGVVGAAELERLAGEIASLFTEDAIWDGGPRLGICTGRAAIRARFLEPTLSFAWHFFVKPKLEVEGDRARGTWDVLAPCTLPDGRPFWMAGVEEDEYRKVDGVWLHSSMRLEVVLFAPHERGWAKKAGSK